MIYRALAAFLILVALGSAAIITAMARLGDQAIFLVGAYMFVPAIAAIIVRLTVYDRGFRDANLRFGRMVDYLRFWAITLGIVLVTYVAYTLTAAVSWDTTGATFLRDLEKQMAASGQDIRDLPAGLTPQRMLLIYFIGGLTLFNIPTVIAGFGEEFGWRGLMLPLLYRIRPWIAFIGGGLIWLTWHVPLAFFLPAPTDMQPWEIGCNVGVLAIGSICAFTFFAYVYAKARSIWVASFVHAVFNNASRSFAYFTHVENQLLANIGLSATMAAVVGWLWVRGEFQVFGKFFGPTGAGLSKPLTM
jgi:membrane protease YdiL (CAAX protease family)